MARGMGRSTIKAADEENYQELEEEEGEGEEGEYHMLYEVPISTIATGVAVKPVGTNYSTLQHK